MVNTESVRYVEKKCARIHDSFTSYVFPAESSPNKHWALKIINVLHYTVLYVPLGIRRFDSESDFMSWRNCNLPFAVFEIFVKRRSEENETSKEFLVFIRHDWESKWKW